MTCDTVSQQLPLILYGELSFDEEEAVHQHLDVCLQCRAEFDRVRGLHAQVDHFEPDLPPQLLQDNRRDLRLAVSAIEDAKRKPAQPGWFTLWWRPAAAAALLVIGFAAGRYTEPASRSPRSEEPVASRVRYVQPDNSGRVQIVVEEVRQRVLEGELDDTRIRSLLVSAAREANDPGVRVDTMDLLKGSAASVEVRRALLNALQHDPNPGVRLKALEAIRTSTQDSESRRVLSQVLLTDENPGIRTQAIDLLTQTREPAIVGVLQELMTREDNNYVRLKCQRVLNDMNASVETF